MGETVDFEGVCTPTPTWLVCAAGDVAVVSAWSSVGSADDAHPAITITGRTVSAFGHNNRRNTSLEQNTKVHPTLKKDARIARACAVAKTSLNSSSCLRCN